MLNHDVQIHPSKSKLAREDQLAWKIATVATDPVPGETAEMIVNRVIDNAAVAVASVRVSPEWAAWANGMAVRELDMHETFLAADYSHPGDNIPPRLCENVFLKMANRTPCYLDRYFLRGVGRRSPAAQGSR